MFVRSSLEERFGGTQSAVGEHVPSRQDYAYCRTVMVGASKNYTYASRFLPNRARPHVEALYALLRVGDDRVDVSHQGFSSPLAAIDDWERSYHRAFQHGDSEHPVLRAYVNTAYEYDIPEGLMKPYFRAMRDDLSVTRFSTFSDLLGYVEGSAVPVGRAMTYILGVREPYGFEQALSFADQLSIAMQLSNFWRDIGEDWRRGRVYIPQEDLAEFGVSEEDLAKSRFTEPLRELMRFEIRRTQDYYKSALQGVPMLASGRWGVMSALLIYRAILTALEQQGYDPFVQRARASGPRKALLAAKGWWSTR